MEAVLTISNGIMLLLAIAWLLQLVRSWKGKREISGKFILVCGVATVFIALEGLQSNLTLAPMISMLTLFAMVAVALRIKK